LTLAACALGLLAVVRCWPARAALPEAATDERAQQPTAPAEPEAIPTAADLIAFLNAQARRVRTLRTDDIDITFVEGEKVLPMGAALAFQRPGQFRLNARCGGKLEIDTGANGSEFWLFMPTLNPHQVLRTTRADLGHGATDWPLPWLPDWLLIVLGLTEHAPAEAPRLTVTPKSIELVEDIPSPRGGSNRLVTVFKRPTVPLQVTGYRLENNKGEVLSTASVVQTCKADATGLQIPQRVTLTFPAQKLAVRLLLQRIQVNTPLAGVDHGLFTPPEIEARKRAVDPPAVPAAPPPAAPQDAVVVVGDARITLARGAQTKITAVKTAEGGRVRLDVAGTVIEAPRLRVETAIGVLEMEAAADGTLQCRTLPRP
jgi:hypothetical protein